MTVWTGSVTPANLKVDGLIRVFFASDYEAKKKTIETFYYLHKLFYN